MHGVTLYVGTTGTGKTHAAIADLKAQTPKGMQVAIMDLGGSKLLEGMAITKGRGSRLKIRKRWQRFVPETVEEYHEELQRIYNAGNTVVLIDDAAALSGGKQLSKLCRLWRPRNLRILLTTQHISGDVDQAIMACDPLIYAFRTTSPRSLEWLAKWHDVEQDEVAALGVGDALELRF